LLLTACTRTVTPTVAVDPAPAPPAAAAADTGITMVAETNAARAVVAAFVAAEARGDAAADTLLLPGTDFVMGGIVITSRPRLAAFVGRGEASLEEAREGLSGAFAYVVVVYRFDGPTPALRERARGTFVLERRTAGWRIRHVHTSMVERW
jgi:ketosteroid isomerase-like protein